MQTMDLSGAASGAVDRSRSFLSRQVEARTAQAGGQLRGVATELRRVLEELRSSDRLGLNIEVADRGADALDRFGSYLETADTERLLTDAEAFARRRPWTTAGLALAAGLGTARFLKASSAERYRSSVERDGD